MVLQAGSKDHVDRLMALSNIGIFSINVIYKKKLLLELYYYRYEPRVD